jgi:eukaryotic-like serine/threonine-protein kinase
MYLKNSNSTKSNMSFLYLLAVLFILAFYSIWFFCVVTDIRSQYAAALSVTSSNFLTYDSPIYGFKIQYPSDWEKIEFSDVQEGNRKIIVNFISPLGNPSDTFREYFIIERGLVKVSTRSLDSSTNTYITSLKSLPNFKLIESQALSLANNPAEKLVYSFSNPQVGVTKVMDTLIIKHDKLFLLSFNSDAATFNNYLPVIQKMLDSLSLS